jgi:acyl-coenzyme A synthetase/AMP-(fatty) acid ligase
LFPNTDLSSAYVVANPGVTPQFITEWVAQRVASHKRLRGGVVMVDAIPKSPSGKILRKELRKRAAEEFKDTPRPAKL